MEYAKPVPTPISSGMRIEADEDGEPCIGSYADLGGVRQYLASTVRADILFAAEKLDRFSSAPRQTHWTSIKRVVWYLNGTMEKRISYKPGRTLKIQEYLDSDFAGDHADRKSTTAYIFLVSGGAILWRSKQKPIVALSTSEEEYVATSTAVREAIWLKEVVKEMGLAVDIAIRLRVDNRTSL